MNAWRPLIILMTGLALTACITENSNLNGQLLGKKPDLHEAARINTQLGSSYANNGEYETALRKLRTALEQDPNYAPAHGAIAYVYSALGQSDIAQSEYEKALDLAPQDAELQNNFGVFLCAHNNPEEAKKHFKLALHNPSYETPAAGYTNLATCLARNNDTAGAKAALQQALNITPNFANAWEAMADLNFQQGEFAQTILDVQKTNALGRSDSHMLWVAVKASTSMENRGLAHEYAASLLNQYPTSGEATTLKTTYPDLAVVPQEAAIIPQ